MNYLFISLLVSIFLGSGCSSIQPEPSKESKAFQHDLKFKVNDRWFIGFATPDKSPTGKYMIEIEPPGSKVDRLIVTTCHRQEVIDKPDSIGWFNKGVKYFYEPQESIETGKTCPMRITTLEEKTRSVGFGFIDFPDSRPEYDLGFRSTCNGDSHWYIGRGFCQSAESLIEVIEFYEPVIVTPTSQASECQVFKREPSKKFEFKLPHGLCTYQFVAERKALNGERVRARFYTFGVSDVPVRF